MIESTDTAVLTPPTMSISRSVRELLVDAILSVRTHVERSDAQLTHLHPISILSCYGR